MFGKKYDELLCPHDKKLCIREKCMGWQVGPMEKTVDGVKQTVLDGNCYIVWGLLIGKAIANRTDGTQAATESMRNEIVKRMDAPLLANLSNIAYLPRGPEER